MRWQYLMSSVTAAAIAVAVATPVHAQAKTATAKKEQAPTKTATNTAQKTENKAISSAEAAPEAWLKGTKLTKAERTQVNTIERKYKKELGDLKKSAAKEDESQVMSKVQAIEDRERDEIRAVLTPTQQTTFDANVAKRKK